MDSFVLKKVVSELKGHLPGALVSKAFQFGKREIYLDLWKPGGSFKLVISAHPSLGSLHTSTRTYKNPPSPPRFTQALRKHLSGMRIREIELTEFERSVTIWFEGRGGNSKAIVAELFGRHSNIILVEADLTIVNALKIITRDASSVREIVSGARYSPLPELPKTFLPHVKRETCREIIMNRWKGIEDSIFSHVHGISRDLISQLSLTDETDEDNLLGELENLVKTYRSGSFTVGTEMGKRVPRKLIPLLNPGMIAEGVTPHKSANEGAEEYFFTLYNHEKLESRKNSLLTVIRKREKKEAKKGKRIEDDIEKLREMEKYGLYGELLKQGLHTVMRGEAEYRAVDYSREPPGEVVIDLDPSISPVQNMNRFFKLYKKGQSGIKFKKKLIPRIKEELEYLSSLRFYIEGARELEELVGIEDEMVSAGLIRVRVDKKMGKKGRGRKAGLPPASQVEKNVVEGYTVYTGKNNRGNDHILRNISSPGDVWLHARYHPGSHVLIKKRGALPVPEEVLYLCAKEAALKSRGSADSKVEVYVADGKDIRKIPGQKPGMVRIAKYRTIIVDTGK